jgi:catechol 2,3-dioxygenase-like lactoylglutathione lyase family enzyme
MASTTDAAPSTPPVGNAALAAYSHVNIVADDLAAARDFYGTKLGLTEIPRPDFGIPGAWFRLGPSQFHIIVVPEMPDLKGAAPHFAVYIPTDDFETTIGALKDKGIAFTSDVRTREDFGITVKTAFCKDPAGNLIEFTDVALFA